MVKKGKKEADTPSSWATSHISYDNRKKILTIIMANNPPKNHGETLEYADVPYEVYKDFVKADSKGRFFNLNIRDSYRKL